MNREGETIRRFMTNQFLFDFDATITEHSNLFELGLIDSFGFVELVRFLESEFQIVFSEDEIVANTLNSLAGIERAVRMKTDAQS